MTRIDIFSGFLGAGKTTLIKKLLSEALQGEKVVLIENEFGEIGIDGGFLAEAGVQVNEMNSGCICCSLVGDFGDALEKAIAEYAPDRIIIEPSGVGKLSDVIRAVEAVAKKLPLRLGSFVAVVDAGKAKLFIRNFGEFYLNQIKSASTILLTRTDVLDPARVEATVAQLREHNAHARIVTTPWSALSGAQLLAAMEDNHSLAEEMLQQAAHEKSCDCGHDHAHNHGEACACGHDHAHNHGASCDCGHDHDHAAHEVFTSWGTETPHQYTRAELEQILTALDGADCGMVLRAKGIVPCACGSWLHFDYVPGEFEIREGAADYTGRLCVIGAQLDEARIRALFGVI